MAQTNVLYNVSFSALHTFFPRTDGYQLFGNKT